MHTDAQECTKMRMGKNPTTFGKKPHSTPETCRTSIPRARQLDPAELSLVHTRSADGTSTATSPILTAWLQLRIAWLVAQAAAATP